MTISFTSETMQARRHNGYHSSSERNCQLIILFPIVAYKASQSCYMIDLLRSISEINNNNNNKFKKLIIHYVPGAD